MIHVAGLFRIYRPVVKLVEVMDTLAPLDYQTCIWSLYPQLQLKE